jgi:hypothetical protein
MQILTLLNDNSNIIQSDRRPSGKHTAVSPGHESKTPFCKLMQNQRDEPHCKAFTHSSLTAAVQQALCGCSLLLQMCSNLPGPQLHQHLPNNTLLI